MNGAQQDKSLVNVLLALADGMLRLDRSVQLLAESTSSRLGALEERIASMEKKSSVGTERVSWVPTSLRPDGFAARTSAPTEDGAARCGGPLRPTESSVDDAIAAIQKQLSEYRRNKVTAGDRRCTDGDGSYAKPTGEGSVLVGQRRPRPAPEDPPENERRSDREPPTESKPIHHEELQALLTKVSKPRPVASFHGRAQATVPEQEILNVRRWLETVESQSGRSTTLNVSDDTLLSAIL